ncbi:GDSL-type esterase/lipase family protein [Paludifilum halophilum]|uniref:SGNH hydrolase-type esterase domain-containing protein n=1 Tax=Paludifilum halophilum TaxID=1642702 RepID=A0A235BCY5_9BACL|nr:GDSL-type esterase/lipase family protein [Paludifilum halophilum]OYD09919.1 hypothetical protein CHM34_02795 [Paludifilum halophilum]
MKIKGRLIWITFSFLAVASLIILAIGFGLAVTEVTGPSTPSPDSRNPSDTDETRGMEKDLLLGLGDSLTRGTGDTNGQGYFERVHQSLREKNRGISAVNLGIKGQTSEDLTKQIQQDRVQRLLKESRWITVTIGGNDLFRGSGSLEKIDLEKAENTRQAYEKNLQSILSDIREQNPDAPVFLFGLYNPFGHLEDSEKTSALVTEWNQTIRAVSQEYTKVVVVPIDDIFQLNPEKYLYSDHFHPNEKGYAFMSQRLMQAMQVDGEGSVNGG